MSDRLPPPDHEERVRATSEREHNVLVAAGAGTGKTTLLVDRVLELIAPRNDGDAISLERIAAITFTRKAAGELRLKIRERILSALADAQVVGLRQKRLFAALAAIDTANVGTIHAFADRLLRQFPVEGRLTPGYEIVEDNDSLLRETFTLLLHAVETGTLTDFLHHQVELVAEASETLIIAQRAGLRTESVETDWWTYHGLDNFVAALIENRDLEIRTPALSPFDRGPFERFSAEYVALVRPLRGEARGIRWFRQNADLLQRLHTEQDPAVLFRELVDRLARGPHGKRSESPTKKLDFDDDGDAWNVWKAFDGDSRKKNAVRATPLRDDLLAPLRQWLATRLVRLRPVALQIYERVKERHRAVDQIDLLLKLRNLLRDDKKVRAVGQGLFDHVFVDEFQDTDPLQAELLLYLCEDGAHASNWTAVRLARGKLTVVGDPKQSIYRFRRADIAMYADVSAIVSRGPHITAQLSASFRTTPRLLDWINDRFDRVLGVARDGVTFDRESGVVFNRTLLKGRAGNNERPVHVLPFELATGGGADDYRRLEAQCVARYLRWLVERSGILVTDRLTREERKVRYGDVAILAFVTTKVPILFHELDRFGIPHVGRGGRLLLQDHLHRQFLLGLRALADREDGVAEAALLRPPFFAVDLQDLLAERAGAANEGAARTATAREIVRDLRRRRFERGVGSTARGLLEQTALARTVALGPNGAQRLGWLRQLCLTLEARALEHHLDFDGATVIARDWVLDPVALDPPHPADGEAVRITTVHQAKGLEFPVVVLWDGRSTWDERIPTTPWQVERNGRAWAIRLDKLEWDEPSGAGIAEREKRYRLAERKRLAYVAVTRARDLLVIPQAGAPSSRMVCGELLSGCDASFLTMLAPHRGEQVPDWAAGIAPVPATSSLSPTTLDAEIAKKWNAAAESAAQPRFRPTAVSRAAHSDLAKPHPGRYGPVFGETVHRAIGIMLQESSTPTSEAVRRAATDTGLSDHVADAVADVDRAVAALQAIGLRRLPGTDLRLEYPVAGAGDNGTLLIGVIDLVSVDAGAITILDFKTDAPPSGIVEDQYPEYVVQLQMYARILKAGSFAGARRGLLFTADGAIRWLP